MRLDMGPRVVQLVPDLVGGGAETVVRALCAGLRGYGVEATAVSIYPSRLDARADGELGVPVVEIGRRDRRDLGYFPRLVRALRALRPDVVHAHLHTGQYAGRIAALLAGAPAIVFTVHGDEPKSALRHILDHALDARTARFVVFTKAQREELSRERQIARGRIEIIPNGVRLPADGPSRDEVRDSLGIPRGAFVLYSAGRFREEKNHRLALAALTQFGPDVHLALAGDGPCEAALRVETRERALEGRVHFLGFRADAAALGRAFDLFVLPSRRERMPVALAEAMLAGLPVVSTPWPGCDDVVAGGEAVFVAANFEADAFAAALRAARGALDIGPELRTKARTFAVSHFSVDEMVRRHAELYQTLVRAAAA
jgi:glycosyltransferase involved in cell wall biosynthesis